MLKNKVFEVRMRKDDKTDDTVEERPAPTIQDYTAHAAGLMNFGGRKLMKGVAFYIALDTARKIAVSRLGK